MNWFVKICAALSLGLSMLALPLQADVDIQEVTTPTGLSAWLVEDHSIPFVALRLAFKGGASLDAPGKRGATNLMVSLLDEGAGELGSQAFTSATESLAARFSFSALDDTVSISARMLSENRTEALALLRKALISPRFDQQALDRVRAMIASNIQSDAQDPNAIAQAAFNRAAFGAHPYGSDAQGSLDSLAALTRDDLIAAHRGVLARDRVYISAVGDITADELSDVLDTLLADLPAKGAPLPEVITPEPPAGVHVTPFETPQSVAVFGHRGIERAHPDFIPAYIAANILGGGGFDNHLMRELREKRGLVYGVYATLAPNDYAPMVLGRFASSNERMAEAIDLVVEEWRKLAETGITQGELDQAKTYLTGAFPLRFDGNHTIAGILVGMQMHDLPISYVNTRNAKVEAVTLDQVNRVIKDVFLPEALHVTVVGQPEGL